MKSILFGAVAAIIVAIGAYAVLDTRFQQTADQRYTTQGVRL
ncbi:hypothetical protein ACVFYP_03550 [Roseomonas sp. F4]